MISPFNGANENGATNSTNFLVSATRDSLFGNTELFSGVSNVAPSFKLTTLRPGGLYTVRFYASRMGVTDNRQTRYTAVGKTTEVIDLDAANNVDQVAVIDSIQPDASNEITISLSPGPNNNNANHFSYLGILDLHWTVQPARDTALLRPAYSNSAFTFDLTAETGRTYGLEQSRDLKTWTPIRSITATNNLTSAEAPAAGDATFYRVTRE
jgi:hypothetical protein